MTEYGLRCSNCDQIVKFDINLTADETHPDYGKRISHIDITCPYCGKRISQLIDDMIVGEPNAVVQTPKIIIEEVIQDLEKCYDSRFMGWNSVEHMIKRLERAKKKL